MEVNKYVIGFAGEGWGAVAALRSLKEYFTIECLSNDQDVTELLSSDDQQVLNFDSFTTEWILCAGYKPIIKRHLLEKYKILNVHYSKLPAYRGLHSTAWAILDGAKELGWTLHVMNEFVDDGPIVYQQVVKNDEVSSASFYMNYFNSEVQKYLGEKVRQYLTGKIIAQPQDKTKASWVAKRTHKHNYVSFNHSLIQIKRMFRVLQRPYPLPKVKYKEKEYEISDADFIININVKPEVGRILNIDMEGIWVGCKDGYLLIKELLFENTVVKSNNNFKLGTYFYD